MKLIQLLQKIKATTDKNPDLLDCPVYVLDTRSGVLETSVSIGDAQLTELDIECSDLSPADEGKRYVAIYLG